MSIHRFQFFHDKVIFIGLYIRQAHVFYSYTTLGVTFIPTVVLYPDISATIQ